MRAGEGGMRSLSGVLFWEGGMGGGGGAAGVWGGVGVGGGGGGGGGGVSSRVG